MHSYRFFLRLYVSNMYTSACGCVREGVFVQATDSVVCVSVSVYGCECLWVYVCVWLDSWLLSHSPFWIHGFRGAVFVFAAVFFDVQLQTGCDKSWPEWLKLQLAGLRRTCALARSNWNVHPQSSGGSSPPGTGTSNGSASGSQKKRQGPQPNHNTRALCYCWRF